MVDKPTDLSLCKAHGEHIIHNGIRGKLISRTILCDVHSYDIDPHSYDVDPLEEGRAFKEQSLFACKQAAA